MDFSALPTTSDLISEELAGQLATVLARLTAPVTLRAVLDDGEKSKELGGFLNRVAALAPDKVQVEYAAAGQDAALDEAVDASLLPAVGVWNADGFCRCVFHGIPGGQEINSFVRAVLNAGGCAKELEKADAKAMAKIKKPIVAQVCVSLGCHHCAQLVADCQRTALENPQVVAHMIDANLYPELVAEYHIERVPVLVLNHSEVLVGGRSLNDLCYAMAHAK